ncbi:pyruvate kinase [Candidatus Neptunochlamydia vexilliferae]|uniref:Pyruvate kinase n=1 Tax=Candidatus Neptunichlamydia vexilliferae TaxID=1651774 RepID=A0ABS0AYY4_9BACT|nr:pyruvate kinase [Candidatus Neptunochlamydia vexilliferae]MBF5059339.1 Pyruvate kinase [Candidatus Neptunochlamydia vexilliferae]
MRTRTKIICTLGPATNSYEKIVQLIDAGMNVARVNMSHGTHEQHEETIDLLKKAREEKEIPLAIMLDTKGPEVRVGLLKAPIELKKGDHLTITKEGEVTLTPFEVIKDVKMDAQVLFDDGYITSKVIAKEEDSLTVEIQNPGTLKSQKGVNIPHADLSLPAVTEQDIKDIEFGCKNNIDILAASFIRSPEHILTIKEILARNKASHVLVIAKIENALGVKNFDAILQAADGIMVARGDLGVELPITQVPKLQKMMIRKCYQSFKPVVTATQMLESMINSPRPTRAEVSDVANAVYDSTSAVMLSGETAVGSYPIETVKLMKSTVLVAEKDFNYEEFFYRDVSRQTFNDISSSVALAAIKTAYSAHGKGLIALTTSGFTARLMARFRPEMPIIAVTPEEKIYHQLAFAWGTVPIHAKVEDVKQGVQRASCYAMTHKLVRYGDLIVVTAGTPFGISGTTNFMLVDNIGEVLVRAAPSEGKLTHGEVTILLTLDTPPDLKDKVVVMPHCDEGYTPHLQGARALVLQNHPDDTHSEEVAKQIARDQKIPIVVRADAACCVLKKGQVVTLDPAKGLIFAGVVESEEEMLRQVCSVR